MRIYGLNERAVAKYHHTPHREIHGSIEQPMIHAAGLARGSVGSNIWILSMTSMNLRARRVDCMHISLKRACTNDNIIHASLYGIM